ncbi:MAG: chemotaxis response regulator protein-glutamate methylesterase [Cyanobacteria bacterium SBLK]|nr:chemotaxis response regulator protein-glutamate methylesterase [Cyanobacteria bacterium SBLK]
MLDIAIVNDSEIAIEALRRAIANTSDYRLIWIARTGFEAVKSCSARRPDLILMDMNMPDLDGVEATRQIMQRSPCGILIVTASIIGNTSKVFEAMGYGALDVVKTPRDGDYRGLLRKIAVVAKLIRPSRIRSSISPQTAPSTFHNPRLPPLIAMGASTGGPNALYQILRRLPASFNAAIVIIQHIDEQFAPGLAQWLDRASPLPVTLARNGDRPEAGKVLLAGTNDHLIVRPNQTLRYTGQPSEIAYRPSVDVFFQSVARYWGQPGIAILLTGMGRDGAEGMVLLKSLGWQTIAESADSCVVFGMPKTAIELGGASHTAPIDRIAALAIDLV